MKQLVLLTALASTATILTACGANNVANTATNTRSNMSPGNSTASANRALPNEGTANEAMMTTSQGAAAQPYDLQYIDTLTKHHNDAITMAKMAVEKAQSPELKAMAEKMISEQQKEITQLKNWRDEWFPGKPQAVNSGLSGAENSMSGMQTLQSATGKAFDLAFIDAMSAHHKGAIQISQDALTKTERPEIKQFAQNVIRAQQDEVAKMQKMKAQMK